eukprot:GHRR01023642.1.p1 GENE.GHRR01023642.1~~GHRR01023642.1.p1  ORF type:complete len:246 (-),score=58.66 GHRR01023642.1:565-1302(-)
MRMVATSECLSSGDHACVSASNPGGSLLQNRQCIMVVQLILPVDLTSYVPDDVCFLMQVAFGGWVFTYAIKQAGLSTYEGHFLNASYWAAFTLGRVIASFAAVVLAPATLLFASLPLAIAGAAVALLTHSDAVWLLLFMSCVLIGMGVSAGFANALALLDTYIPCTGSITGLLGGLAGAGCMTVPLVVAVLAKHTALQYQGLMWVSLVSFVAQLACVPVALAFGKRLAALQYVQKAHEDLLPATI